jgi:hypothetical protein
MNKRPRTVIVIEQPSNVLDLARLKLGLSQGDLWFHYFKLGGMSSELDVEAFLADILEPSAHDHDLIAHALNECFTEIGQNHPVPYLADEPDGDQSRTAK